MTDVVKDYIEAGRALLEALETFQQVANAKLDTTQPTRIGERQRIAEMKRKATELEIALLNT